MIAIDDLRLIVRIADLSNLSAAARQLGWLPATASAAFKRVEAELGVRIFDRPTRAVRPTEVGLVYLDSCRRALQALDDAAEKFSSDARGVAGYIRITATSDLGRHVLVPWLEELQDTYPELRISLLLGDHLADLFEEGVDFALRHGMLDDSTLVRRVLASSPRAMVASPAYPETHGRPRTPEDLGAHRCLVHLRRGERINRWIFGGPKGPMEVTVESVACSDDGAIISLWALAGRGLAFKSWLDVAADVAAGRLVPLFPEWSGPEIPLQLLSKAREYRPRRFEVCADFLAERFRNYAARHPFTRRSQA
ncbi:MAG: LysR family transcriptional regulator [Candidatus Protistobacter heckmanni]|nr:LysR family transcriptional regulator [Candidatus Protistobacter heckmanni]